MEFTFLLQPKPSPTQPVVGIRFPGQMFDNLYGFSFEQELVNHNAVTLEHLLRNDANHNIQQIQFMNDGLNSFFDLLQYGNPEWKWQKIKQTDQAITVKHKNNLKVTLNKNGILTMDDQFNNIERKQIIRAMLSIITAENQVQLRFVVSDILKQN